MKSALLFTDVSITGQSRGGHVNSVRSMAEFLKSKFLLNMVSIHDAQTIVQKIILFLYRAESKIYRTIYELIFKTNPPCNVYKYSFVLCLYMFVLTRVRKYDYVVIEYIHFSYLLPFVKVGSKVVIDTIDIMHQRTRSYLENGHFDVPSNSKISKCKELEILSKFDVVVVIQEDEKKYLSSQVDAKVILSPRHFDIVQKFSVNDDKVIGFIGGKADFNVDGLTRFIDEVWVTSRVRLGGWVLRVYGQVCDALEDDKKRYYSNIDGVEFIGEVNQVSEAYKNSSVMINPIYYGSGLKTKNVESLCHARPLITTDVGIQGMRFTLGDSVHLYSSASEFLEILEKFESRDYLNLATQEAHKIAQENFSIEACYSSLSKAM